MLFKAVLASFFFFNCCYYYYYGQHLCEYYDQTTLNKTLNILSNFGWMGLDSYLLQIVSQNVSFFWGK